MTGPLAIVAAVTTGPDPDRHGVFEAAVIVRDEAGSWEELAWWLSDVSLAGADRTAIRTAQFFPRIASEPPMKSPQEAAAHLAMVTAGTHLVLATPHADRFIEQLIRAGGMAPAWHDQLVDVASAVAGRLGLEPPWSIEDLSKLAGVDPPPANRRVTAVGAAHWTKALYEAGFGIRPGATRRRRRPGPPPEAVDEPTVEQPADVDADGADAEEGGDDTGPEDAELPPTVIETTGMPDANETYVCEEEDCDSEVPGPDALFSWTRYRRILCKPHFAAMKVD